MWPCTMNSSSVVASKSGGGRNPTFMVTVGRAAYLYDPAVLSICQSGSSVWPLRHRTLISTTVFSPTMPFQLA